MREIVKDGNLYRIRFDYDPEVVHDLRSLPGRRVYTDTGEWTVPAIFSTDLRRFAEKHSFEGDVAANAEPVPAKVDFDGNVFRLTFDYTDTELTLSAASIPGAIWWGPTESWIAPPSQGMAINLWAETASARCTDAAEDAIAEGLAVEENVRRSAAKESDFYVTGLGIELYDYQRAGVDYAVNVAHGRCIIGDEPGVGKTAQALAVVQYLAATPAILVVPASLKVNWRREVKTVTPHLSVEILRGRRAPDPRLLWADVTILNYDILDAWLEHLPTPRAVVFDESHKIMNPKITRTKAALELADRVPDEENTARLCLTGTAVQNRPNEILTQVQAIGRIERLGGITKARRDFKRDGITLNRQLRSFGYLRRLKKDVWVDAPGRHWADVVVEGDPKAMVEYRKAEADIVKFLAEQARRAALASGATTEEAKEREWQAQMRATAGEHLVAISHLKRIAARAKMPAAREWAKTMVESGEKLAVYGWHTEVVDSMADALQAVKLQGGMTEGARERSVFLFQNVETCRVFCGQILAAGEGITLTAASNALLVEQAWTPGAMDQVLDRHHRRGQENDVTGWLMLTEDTIDLDIKELIEAKRKIVDETLNGSYEQEEADGGSVLQDLVVSLAKRGLKKSP